MSIGSKPLLVDRSCDTTVVLFERAVEELDERLEADLSYRDWLAVRTCLAKVCEIGFNGALAALTSQLVQQDRQVDIAWRNDPGIDEWAVEFGEDGVSS